MYYLGVILVTFIAWMIFQILKDLIKGNGNNPEIESSPFDQEEEKVAVKKPKKKPARKPARKAAPKKTASKALSKKVTPKKASTKKQKKS